MFGHIRRHQKWLWIFISAAVIISFVWFFSPTQQMQGGGGDPRAAVGTIYGDPISLSEYQDARREAELHYLLSNGQWARNDEFARQMKVVERETRNRLFLTRKLKDYDIKVDDRAAAEWIATAFQDRQTKRFQTEFVDRFLETIRAEGIRESDFERYVRHQVGIQHLAAIAGAPGKLVTPQAAERELRQEREKVDTKVVVFPLSNYLAKVQVSPQEIATYYTNASARYRLPERVQLSYVAFPATNYLAQADQRLAGETNLNQRLDAIYMQRGPQFYTSLDGQPLAPEEARQRIREEMRKELALMEAQRAAYEFANALEQVEVNPGNPNPAEPLENIAASKGLSAQVTQPFSQFEGPSEINLPEQFLRYAFQMTPEAPIVQEPVVGEDGAYVIAFKRRLQSELQPFDAIRAQVEEDYRRSEALRMVREAAMSFVNAATNALKSGGQIESVAQAQGMQVADLPPVLRESRDPIENLPPMVDAGALRSAAAELSAGEVSSYIPTRDGGFVVFVENVIPPTDAEVQQALPEFAQEYRRRSAANAFNDWFSKEMQAANLRVEDGLDTAEM